MDAPMRYLAAALLLLLSLPASAQDLVRGDIRISQPWTRATPGGAKVAAGYLEIAMAGVLEIHDMTMTDGVMRMRRVDGGLEIKPGQTVALRPGGLHVMFMELKQPLKQGEKVKGTLVFEKAGTIEVEYTVAAIGAAGPDGKPAGGGAMQNHKH
jgi:copper(I)-binding protein